MVSGKNTSPDETVENTDETSGIIPEYLLWKCNKCDETTEGTDKAYINFCKKHPKKNGCKVVLVDGPTGEVLAKDLRDAQGKGIFKYRASSKDDNTPGSPTIPRDNQPLYTGYFKTEKVELNGRLWIYRDVFIQEKFIPPDTKMGDFILGAVETLMELSHIKIGIIQTVPETIQEGGNS